MEKELERLKTLVDNTKKADKIAVEWIKKLEKKKEKTIKTGFLGFLGFKKKDKKEEITPLAKSKKTEDKEELEKEFEELKKLKEKKEALEKKKKEFEKAIKKDKKVSKQELKSIIKDTIEYELTEKTGTIEYSKLDAVDIVNKSLSRIKVQEEYKSNLGKEFLTITKQVLEDILNECEEKDKEKDKEKINTEIERLNNQIKEKSKSTRINFKTEGNRITVEAIALAGLSFKKGQKIEFSIKNMSEEDFAKYLSEKSFDQFIIEENKNIEKVTINSGSKKIIVSYEEFETIQPFKDRIDQSRKILDYNNSNELCGNLFNATKEIGRVIQAEHTRS